MVLADTTVDRDREFCRRGKACRARLMASESGPNTKPVASAEWPQQRNTLSGGCFPKLLLFADSRQCALCVPRMVVLMLLFIMFRTMMVRFFHV